MNCWIEGKTAAEADEFARRILRRRGWTVEAVAEVYPISREDYDDGHSPEGLAAYEDAQRTGQCFICHAYLAEPAEI